MVKNVNVIHVSIKNEKKKKNELKNSAYIRASYLDLQIS